MRPLSACLRLSILRYPLSRGQTLSERRAPTGRGWGRTGGSRRETPEVEGISTHMSSWSALGTDSDRLASSVSNRQVYRQSIRKEKVQAGLQTYRQRGQDG